MLIFGGEKLKWHSSCDIDELHKIIEIYRFSNPHTLNVIIHMPS